MTEIPKEILKEVPARIALRYTILPLSRENGSLKLLAPPELSKQEREELRIVLGKELEFVEGSRPEIESALSKAYGVGAGVIETLTQETEEEQESFNFEIIDQDKSEEATITRLVNELLLDALKRRASDIHIEPFEHVFRIRYRVDGLLQEARVSEKIKSLAPSLISRIKIMASLDIGEKRLPQDGRIKISAKKPGGSATSCGGKVEREELDLRISVYPSSAGEAIVIRILKPLELLNLEELGFDEEALQKIRSETRKPHGMILLTGPTGSGKTTTLYACLKELNSIERKIITIEDPIEYKLPGIIQSQVNPKIGLTFAKALRSMLRHDPDILMVGEIRDPETAEIAIRSALTGHLVLSTLHTNDAPSAAARLLEMGIEPYLVTSSLNAVIAQRLVRKLCPPCGKCGRTGFFGRTAVYELMILSDSLRKLMAERRASEEIRNQAAQEGMIPIRDNGLKKVREALTSASEIDRAL